MELVSIIMAAYNAEKTIAAAVESVLQQTYRQFELLVINDHSTDHTEEIVRHYAKRDSRIKRIDLPKNSGVSAARLAGARQAKGIWIAVLDSDDIWLPDKLEKQLVKQRETGAQLLYTGAGFMDAEGRPLRGYLSAPKMVSYRELLKQNRISNSSVLVKKELYLRYYVQRDDLHEDFALWLRLLRTGVKAYGVDEPLLIYRISSTSKSGKKWRSAKMNWNTYRYIGLGIAKSIYYMCWYAVNGVKKYGSIGRK